MHRALVLVMLAVLLGACGGAEEVDAPQAAPTEDAVQDEQAPSVTSEPPEEDEGSSATTGERPDPQEDPYAFSYQIGYEICENDPQALYDEAGTDDPVEAASWYGDGLQDGPHREGGVAGCLDGLQGAVARY